MRSQSTRVAVSDLPCRSAKVARSSAGRSAADVISPPLEPVVIVSEVSTFYLLNYYTAGTGRGI
jgi:hypothetical protein